MKIGEKNGVDKFWDQFWMAWSGLILAAIVLASWRIVAMLMDFN